jgi:hypothetical protein
MYKLFDQKKYKGLSLLVAGLSVLSLILGWYFMVDIFGGGYTNLRWLSNFLMALMLSFLICELFVAPFFFITRFT